MRGIVLTMYDARTKLAEQVEREVREPTSVRRCTGRSCPATVRISEAPSFGQPIIVFDPYVARRRRRTASWRRR